MAKVNENVESWALSPARALFHQSSCGVGIRTINASRRSPSTQRAMRIARAAGNTTQSARAPALSKTSRQFHARTPNGLAQRTIIVRCPPPCGCDRKQWSEEGGLCGLRSQDSALTRSGFISTRPVCKSLKDIDGNERLRECSGEGGLMLRQGS